MSIKREIETAGRFLEPALLRLRKGALVCPDRDLDAAILAIEVLGKAVEPIYHALVERRQQIQSSSSAGAEGAATEAAQ